MAESRRLLIATLAGLVIFSLIPHSNAETVEPTEIEIQLNALEDYYLAMKSLENVSSGKSRLWTQEELEAECDLGDSVDK